MREKSWLTLVWAIGAVLAFGGSAFTQSFDGQYTATLNCDKLPFTKAPLTDEPVTLTISNGNVSYLRTLYGYDRNTIVGNETGTGTIAADGTIALNGGWKGERDNLEATYRGKLSAGGATLIGRHVMTYQGQKYDRTCSMIFAN